MCVESQIHFFQKTLCFRNKRADDLKQADRNHADHYQP